MVSRSALIFLLIILISGCRPATPPPGPADRTQAAPTAAPEATAAPARPTILPAEVAEIRNAPYQLGATESLQVFQLTDGKFVQGTRGNDNYLSINVTDFAAVGDLNTDGTQEVAALVAENYGGTGTFVFLAVYASIDGKLVFQTSVMVDDRPQLNALSIKDGEIFLDAVVHGTEDSMCCPTLKTIRHYRLSGNQLEMTDFGTFTPQGKPRTITITSPGPGEEVFTSVPLKGSVEIAPFENNLDYRIYDTGGVELAAGSITVSAPEAGGPGTFDMIVPLGRILSGAVIRIEVQEISAADGSLLAMNSVELVVK